MKKYCLSYQGKKDIKGFLLFVLIILGSLLGTVAILAMISVFDSYFFFYIRAVGLTLWISVGVLSLYGAIKWTYLNIEEC